MPTDIKPDLTTEDQEKLEDAQKAGPVQGFFEFIRQQGVVGLAVGFILGDSVKQLVSAIVDDLINPVLAVMLGAAGNIQDFVLYVGPISFSIGHLVTAIIDFAVIAAVVYFGVKGLKLDKLDLPKDK